jgi:superfamily II DNA/RNA helicase
MPLQKGEGPVGMIICPSRELARQTFESVQGYAAALREDGHPELRTMLCMGGVDMRTQQDALSRGVHMVVATPGRLKVRRPRQTDRHGRASEDLSLAVSALQEDGAPCGGAGAQVLSICHALCVDIVWGIDERARGGVQDMLHKKKLNLDICRYLCLDEADRMVDQGFEEDMRDVRSYLKPPPKKKKAFTSLLRITCPVEPAAHCHHSSRVPCATRWWRHCLLQ